MLRSFLTAGILLFAGLFGSVHAYDEVCTPIQQTVQDGQSFGVKSPQVPESMKTTCKIAQGCICKANSCVWTMENGRKVKYTSGVNCKTPNGGVDLGSHTGPNAFPNGCQVTSVDISFNKVWNGKKCTAYQGCSCSVNMCTVGGKTEKKDVKCTPLPG